MGKLQFSRKSAIALAPLLSNLLIAQLPLSLVADGHDQAGTEILQQRKIVVQSADLVLQVCVLRLEGADPLEEFGNIFDVMPLPSLDFLSWRMLVVFTVHDWAPDGFSINRRAALRSAMVFFCALLTFFSAF